MKIGMICGNSFSLKNLHDLVQMLIVSNICIHFHYWLNDHTDDQSMIELQSCVVNLSTTWRAGPQKCGQKWPWGALKILFLKTHT